IMGLFSKNTESAAAAAPAEAKTGIFAHKPTPVDDPDLIVTPPAALRPAPPAPVQLPPPERNIHLEKLKVKIHQQLVERLDVQNLRSLPPDTVRAEVKMLVRELCQSEKGLLNSADQ